MFLDNILMAFNSLKSHKLRSILTMLGIIIGVSSILLIIAIGKGGEYLLKKEIIGNDNNTLDIQYLDESLMSLEGKIDTPIFQETTLVEMKNKFDLQNVVMMNSSIELFNTIDSDIRLNIIGANYDYFIANSINIIIGEEITEDNFSRMQNSVYFSEDAAEKLFDSNNIIGEIIEIRDTPFRISGIYESESGLLNIPKIIIPIYTWPTTFLSNDIQSVSIKTYNPHDLMDTANQVVNWLNESKSESLKGEYQIFNIQDLKKGISTVTNILTIIIGSVAGISLVVGGIGIMNMMLVTVTERTKEIGLRMALGATKGQILLQFLIESLFISFIGGIIGIIISGIGTGFIAYFTDFPVLISVPSIILSILISLLLGALFGIMPASKAANQQPTESLRFE